MAILSLLAVLWNSSAFGWVYLSFSPLLYLPSQLFVSSDNLLRQPFCLSAFLFLGGDLDHCLRQEWKNNSGKNEEMEPKQKQHPVVDVTGNGSKVRCCKEQYCIGTWNVRSMNQGKLEAVKQEMARVNIDILGISELKWTGMGKSNPDDHYIYWARIS